MGLTLVPSDQLATVVTTLEMRERPRPRPLPTSRLAVKRWRAPPVEQYRTLFRRVGAPWLWYSRLALSDAALARKLASDDDHVFAVIDGAGVEVGLLELFFGDARMTELGFLALVPELVGRGHGAWLMAHALMLGWRPGVERIRVNTCTLDHPRALGFYIAHGFTPVARTIETFPDPRALGLLPEDAAPQIPYLAKRR